MITGVGIDIIHIQRMERWYEQHRLLERFFHPLELAAILSCGGAVQTLASRFAAKEAFGKALGTGLAGMALKDIMVIKHPNGRPELQVFNAALKALEQNGATRIHLSLAHEKDNAVAVVVLEVA